MHDEHINKKILLFKEIKKLLYLYGWSQDLIDICNNNAGFLENYDHILFSRGIKEIVEEFESWQDRNTIIHLENVDKENENTSSSNKPSVRGRISTALKYRIINSFDDKSLDLSLEQDNQQFTSKCEILKKSCLQTSKFFTKNLAVAATCRLGTVDAIWRYAGDQSTDYNYYTKRGLLFPVYVAAHNYFITDNSQDYQNTKKFIDSCLNNIVNIMGKGKKISSFKTWPIVRFFST